MRVVSIVGARPQFVKLAPIARAFAKAGFEHVIVHTGQHYDANMSSAFFADLRIPQPDFNLGVGSDSHARQIAGMLTPLESLLSESWPDWVVVYGDTNSTLAGAVTAARLGVPLAHLEAGLRSGQRSMPEEQNRVVTDHLADLLLTPSTNAMNHLASEGLAQRAVNVGDVMIDICRMVDEASSLAGPPVAGLRTNEYYAATIHRAENTADPDRLKALIEALQRLDLPVILAAHPRLRRRAVECGITLGEGSVRVTDPLAYDQMLALVRHARAVLTDSGGLQKEAYYLGTKCVTLRTETEWPETLVGGWNTLAVDRAEIEGALLAPVSSERAFPYGRGHAAQKVVETLQLRFDDEVESEL